MIYAGSAAAGAGGGSSSFLLIFMVLAVAALFFMNSRARKRQAAAGAFRNDLQPGQEVMTASGMFGTVAAVDGDKVTLVSAGGQESVWLLAAIGKLVEDEPQDEGDDVDEVTDGEVSDSSPADDPTSRYIAGAADAQMPDLRPDGTPTTPDEKSR